MSPDIPVLSRLEDIKTLESEIAEIDAGQAEATVNRQKEHEEYVKASTDFKESARAAWS